MVEVTLTYVPDTLEPGGCAVTIGRTRAPALLRAMRDQLLAEAAEEVAMWEQVDPVIGGGRRFEAERLARMLALVLPYPGLHPAPRPSHPSRPTPAHPTTPR